MTLPRRLRWAGSALMLIAIGATIGIRYVPAKPAAHSAPVASTAPAPPAIAPASGISTADAQSDSLSDNTANNIVDIFAVRTWEPPKPVIVAAKPAPPPPPQAPPLPFKFLGKIADPDKGTAYLLNRDGNVLSVGVGDDIDGTYRVDKLEGGQLYFLYQPLHQRQALAVGSDS